MLAGQESMHLAYGGPPDDRDRRANLLSVAVLRTLALLVRFGEPTTAGIRRCPASSSDYHRR